MWDISLPGHSLDFLESLISDIGHLSYRREMEAQVQHMHYAARSGDGIERLFGGESIVPEAIRASRNIYVHPYAGRQSRTLNSLELWVEFLKMERTRYGDR